MPALINPKYEHACQMAAAGKLQKEAYEAAGYKYSPSAASKFFNRPQIKTRIAEIYASRRHIDERATQRAVDTMGLTKEWVIKRLMYLAETALRGQPVLDEHGVQTGQFSGRPQGATAARALELLGSHLGMFVQRHELGEPGSFAHLSDEALAKEVAAKAAELGVTIPPHVVAALVAREQGERLQ